MKRVVAVAGFLVMLSVPAARADEGAQSLLCHRVAHTPAADVAFTPGVDVHGNPVVPADINASTITPPQVAQIPLTIDLARWLGLALPEGVQMESAMGLIEVFPDGRVSYNGQDLAPALARACAPTAAAAPAAK